jgi:hypothetical protein
MEIKMIENVLPGVKIDKIEYSASHHTFLVLSSFNGEAPIMRPFNKLSFPNHTPFSFLDEKVQIGDKVWVYLKPETELKLAGYKEVGKTTLQPPEGGLKLGSDKRKMLGSVKEGRIAVSPSWKPIIVIGDYRFIPAEVKCIIKSDLSWEVKDAEVTGPHGKMIFDKKSNILILPNGATISGMYLKDLKKLISLANV